MRITFDRKTNAAYIFLVSVEENISAHTYPCDPIEVGGEINLDFNLSGQLIGIEVMDATRLLSEELLKSAEIIG